MNQIISHLIIFYLIDRLKANNKLKMINKYCNTSNIASNLRQKNRKSII